MTEHRDNSGFPFGSARFATEEEMRRAGMFEQTPTSVYCGELNGRSLWHSGDGPVLLKAGARSGKLRDIIAYTICRGVYDGGSMVVLDVKGELAAISYDLVSGDDT